MTEAQRAAMRATVQSCSRQIAAALLELDRLTADIDEADHPLLRASLKQRAAIVRERIRRLEKTREEVAPCSC